MSGKAMRIVAGALAILLAAAYFFMPMRQAAEETNNSGMKKAEVAVGEEQRWTWTAEKDYSAVTLWLSGTKKAQGLTLRLAVTDAAGGTAASLDQAIADLGDGDYVTLRGALRAGTAYTLAASAEGEGSIKIRGEALDDGSFLPWMRAETVNVRHNPILLYLALGLVLAALVPLKEKKRTRRPRARGAAALMPWAAFLTVAVTGLLVVFLKPAGPDDPVWMLWDEQEHWTTIQAMTMHGNASLADALGGVSTWTPGYLPLILGIELAGIFTDELMIMYRVGAVFSVLAGAALCALAVARAPRWKAVFLLAGTLPVSIYLTTGMTYDPAVIYSILLGMALLLEALDRDEPVGAARGITLLALLGFGTIAKPAYCAALLPLLLLPKEKLGGRARAWGFRILAVLMIAWVALAVALPGPYDAQRGGDVRFADADAAAQGAYLTEHPAEILMVPLRYAVRNGRHLLVDGIGSYAYLGYSAAASWLFAGLLLLAAPLAVCGERKEPSPLKAGRRIVFALSAVIPEFVLMLTQYVVSSPVGGSGIDGMQRRYILPVWILLALALMMPEKARRAVGKAGGVLAAALCCVTFAANLGFLLHMAGRI